MFQLYCVLVCSKLDCGSFMYGSTTKSKYSGLDSPQHYFSSCNWHLLYQPSGGSLCEIWRTSTFPAEESVFYVITQLSCQSHTQPTVTGMISVTASLTGWCRLAPKWVSYLLARHYSQYTHVLHPGLSCSTLACDFQLIRCMRGKKYVHMYHQLFALSTATYPDYMVVFTGESFLQRPTEYAPLIYEDHTTSTASRVYMYGWTVYRLLRSVCSSAVSPILPYLHGLPKRFAKPHRAHGGLCSFGDSAANIQSP